MQISVKFIGWTSQITSNRLLLDTKQAFCISWSSDQLLVNTKTDRALRHEENKFEFLEGRFLDEKLPFLHKKNTEHSLNFLLSIFFLLTVYLNIEMQNSGLKTTTCWSRGSHFVENGYPSRRFPNMVQVNIHEHWKQDRQSKP